MRGCQLQATGGTYMYDAPTISCDGTTVLPRNELIAPLALGVGVVVLAREAMRVI